MKRFSSTGALVSGAARGMGASHVRGLVAEGARVVVGDVLDLAGKALGTWHRRPLCPPGRDRCFAVGPGGSDRRKRIRASHTPREQRGQRRLWRDRFDDARGFPSGHRQHLTGTWLGMHATVASLRKAKGGAIITISSTAGLMGYASIGAYTASKWGVRGLTKSAALELGPFGIRVMSIHPGPIATPMTAGMGEHMTASQPIARWGTVEEVTRLMLFMASEATDSTGSAWVIDGGAVLGPIQELGSGRHSTDDVAVAASRVEAATGYVGSRPHRLPPRWIQ